MLNPDRSSEASEEHPVNIPAIFATLAVSKSKKSKEVIDLQYINIPCMFATFEVSKEERSRETRDLQFLNANDISVTFAESKCDKSREVSDSQPLNTPLILVVRDVSRPERSIDPIWKPSKNKLLKSVGAMTFLSPSCANTTFLMMLYSPAQRALPFVSSPVPGCIVKVPYPSISQGQSPQTPRTGKTVFSTVKEASHDPLAKPK